MRRRDAKRSGDVCSERETRWPLWVAVVVSLALHTALIVAAASRCLRRPAPIAVALVMTAGGSGGGERAPGSAAVSAASLPSSPRVTVPKPRRHAAARTAHVGSAAADATETQGSGLETAGTGDAGGGSADAGGSAASSGGGGLGNGLGQGGGFYPRPLCLYCPEPTYPLLARARGWQGSVEVALSVLADGSVDTASLGRSSGYPALDAAAIAVARQSRFRQPSTAGLTAPLQGRIEYRFILRGG